VLLSYIRTVILYLVLIIVIRLMGKRQVGQLEPSEFVVTMLVANLASIPMQDGGIPLYTGLVPILTVSPTFTVGFEGAPMCIDIGIATVLGVSKRLGRSFCVFFLCGT
jgi:hypothetical protein